MRGRTVASIVTLVSSGVFLTACGASNDCSGNGTCPPEPGWVCTPDDGGVANCNPPDGSASDASEDGGQDATVPGDAGHDAGRDAAQDTSLSDAGSDGSVVGDGGTDATQDSGVDASLTCDGGLSACNGACVPLTTVAHCGACGTSCTQAPDGGEPACVENDAGAYACTFACNVGEHSCNGACFPNTDPPGVAGDTCVVSPTYGVFVAPTPAGSDANDAGTPMSPFATVAAAAAYAKAHSLRDVFVCGGTYGAISLDAAVIDGINVFGGLECSNWTYSASAVAFVDAGNAGPALWLSGLTVGTTFADFGFYSGNATTPGGSSIAVFTANSANVAFQRCTMTAGNGMSATPGVVGSNYSGVAPPGSAPDGGAGGAGGSNTCLLSGQSSGGAGGDGPSEGDGGAGTASPPAVPDVIDGYTGAGGAGGPNNGTGCSANSHAGANGAAAISGGIGATRWGTLSTSGWVAAGGQDGAPGNPGQGGGGGGGIKSPAIGGGGGGAGGCGGAGGPGGGGGGSSFALLSYQSTALTLAACRLSAAAAGSGADGALGQTGQGGAAGAFSQCNGGFGGNGAGGGSGGGGAGGISAPVAYTGTAPNIGASTLTPGTAGAGGHGVGTGASGGAANAIPAPAGLPSTGGIDGGAFAAPVSLD